MLQRRVVAGTYDESSTKPYAPFATPSGGDPVAHERGDDCREEDARGGQAELRA